MLAPEVSEDKKETVTSFHPPIKKCVATVHRFSCSDFHVVHSSAERERERERESERERERGRVGGREEKSIN